MFDKNSFKLIIGFLAVLLVGFIVFVVSAKIQ